MKDEMIKTKIAYFVLGILLMMLNLCACANQEETSGYTYEGTANNSEETEQEEENEKKTYVDYLDIHALDEIEARDNFEVKISDIEIRQDVFVNDGDGSDAVCYMIVNECDHHIAEFEIFTIGYTEDRNQVRVCRNGYTLNGNYLMAFVHPSADIASGEEYSYNIACYSEDFYNVKAIVASYTTQSGDTYVNPIAEEWEDIVYYGSDDMESDGSIEDFYYPPADDYDELLINDERYFLCKKYVSGFDEDSVYYGIYDGETGEWTFEFTDLDAGDRDSSQFYNHGDGVFCFTYLSEMGNTKICFLSSDLGNYFTCNADTEQEEINFVNGKAFLLLHQDTAIENGRGTPNNKLYFLTTYGEIEEISIQGFEEDPNYYWNSVGLSDNDDTQIYARSFENYASGDRITYIYVYFYETNEYLIIDYPNYTEKLVTNFGTNPDNSSVHLNNDVLRIDGLKGVDGNRYYAEFDKAGNLVTKATLQ